MVPPFAPARVPPGWAERSSALWVACLQVQAGVAATTITRLSRTDEKAASALSLDLASKIVTVLDCGIEDLLEVVPDPQP